MSGEIPEWILALRGRMGEGSDEVTPTTSVLADVLTGRTPILPPPEDSSESESDTSTLEYDSEEEREIEEWERTHVVPPEEEWKEPWTRSECPCEVCTEMNRGVDEWASRGAPRTMLDVIFGDAVDRVVDHLRDEIAQHPDVDEPPL